MDKLLHERLRESKKGQSWIGVRPYDDEFILWRSDAERLAHEIERYYIPRPRFEDGEPVKKGSKTDVCDVWSFDISSDGYWRLYDDDGVEFDYGEDGEFVKRPTPKVYDADGVEIKVGDTVFDIEACQNENAYWGKPLTVMECSLTHTTVYQDGEGTNLSKPHDCFAHEKPVFDSEGVRICKGDTVWHKESDEEYEVIDTPFSTLGCLNNYLRNKRTEHLWFCDPSKLTHNEPDNIHKLMDDATKPQRQYYNDFIGHDVGLRDDEEINVAVHTHIINRAMEIAKRNQC